MDRAPFTALTDGRQELPPYVLAAYERNLGGILLTRVESATNNLEIFIK